MSGLIFEEWNFFFHFLQSYALAQHKLDDTILFIPIVKLFYSYTEYTVHLHNQKRLTCWYEIQKQILEQKTGKKVPPVTKLNHTLCTQF